MIYTDIISFFSSYSIGTPFALLTLQMIKTHISLKRRNNKGSTLSCSLHRRLNLTSVSNVCEAVPRSLFYFRPPTDSTNYRKGVSNFLLIWLTNRQWLFEQANHGAYSNPGTQVGAHNKDFGTVSQTDVTRVTFRLWGRPIDLKKEMNVTFFPLLCALCLKGLEVMKNCSHTFLNNWFPSLKT